MRRASIAGWAALLLLFGLSYAFGQIWPEVPARACPFGADALRPDRTVCELAFGGLWVSLATALFAAALATALGLAVAVAARSAGGVVDRGAMRFADCTPGRSPCSFGSIIPSVAMYDPSYPGSTPAAGTIHDGQSPAIARNRMPSDYD